ncbi:MAG: hypothetical protein U9Q15_03330 [Patescibacteria group bacterium]|nr:hypothetical protein [Patescibacteria group bacterium]
MSNETSRRDFLGMSFGAYDYHSDPNKPEPSGRKGNPMKPLLDGCGKIWYMGKHGPMPMAQKGALKIAGS